MKVLVTGYTGQLGYDVVKELQKRNIECIGTMRKDFSLTDTEKMKSFVENYRPDAVIHCAAYTAVDNAEDEPELCRAVNTDATRELAQICKEINAKMIYISTDYVFDGTKKTPYTPEDDTRPLNKYGLTKLRGEEEVKKYCEKYYIARTSWLYGHHGNNFVETMLKLAAENKEIKVVDDQIGCPTWTVELANGILKLLSMPYGTYHVCGSGSTSWYGFAREIFEQSGLKVDLKPCTTEDFPRPAKRPRYSVMENNGICRSWQAALHDYLQLRNV